MLTVNPDDTLPHNTSRQPVRNIVYTGESVGWRSPSVSQLLAMRHRKTSPTPQSLFHWKCGLVSLPRLGDEDFDLLKVQYSCNARITGFYLQGRLHSLQTIDLYLTHRLRWAKGLSLVASSTLDAISQILNETLPM